VNRAMIKVMAESIVDGFEITLDKPFNFRKIKLITL